MGRSVARDQNYLKETGRSPRRPVSFSGDTFSPSAAACRRSRGTDPGCAARPGPAAGRRRGAAPIVHSLVEIGIVAGLITAHQAQVPRFLEACDQSEEPADHACSSALQTCGPTARSNRADPWPGSARDRRWCDQARYGRRGCRGYYPPRDRCDRLHRRARENSPVMLPPPSNPGPARSSRRGRSLKTLGGKPRETAGSPAASATSRAA